MGERISIQYTVDVEQLPREVGRILETAFNEYHMLQADCRNDSKITTLSHKMVEKIDNIRLSLADIDHGLNDASNIISGYLSYKTQEGQPQPLDLPREDLASVDVDELAEKIDKFKSFMETPKEDEISD